LSFCHFQAEVYVNLLDGETLEVDGDSLVANHDDVDANYGQTRPDKTMASLVVDESDETASSVSTLSTIQSRHVTPLATPTSGLSKRTTPRSSFTTYDKTSSTHFDLAKLLDPFEQLEREFNWADVTIRPPSAFSSMIDVRDQQQQQQPTNAGTKK
jgi:hypothetical protein